jgi:hypothetical protein
VPTLTVTSWRDFDDAITAADSGCGRPHARSSLVFRGLPRADHRNRASIERLGDGAPALERHLIRNFRKYAHRERPGPSLWDWLSLAQHHGLPTRLLDWTFSPLVAAHFATATWPDHDAMVWAVDCVQAHHRLPCELRDPLEVEGAMVFTTELLAEHVPTLEALDAFGEHRSPFALFFEPPSFDDRIVNQSAVLSVTSGAAGLERWLDEHSGLTHAWRITADAKQEIRERLDRVNVNERVLMPGLDGLAAWLRRYYTPLDRDDPSGADAYGDHKRPVRG